MLDQVFQVGFLAAMVRIATPLAAATLGEMVSERAGVLNLGIEGIMLLSAMTGFTTAFFSGSLWLGVLAAALTGALVAALHAVLTVLLGLSQHVSGIAVTLFASGLAFFLYRLIFGQPSTPPSIQGFPPSRCRSCPESRSSGRCCSTSSRSSTSSCSPSRSPPSSSTARPGVLPYAWWARTRTRRTRPG